MELADAPAVVEGVSQLVNISSHAAVALGFLAWIPAAAQPAFPIVLTPDPPTQYYRDNADRLHDYVFRTYTDPARLAWLIFDSSVDHWTRAPHQWDRSAQSFSYRFASGWGRRIVRNTAQLGFESFLHEDSRYRRSGSGRADKRVWSAISQSVLAHKPDGSVEPMYGRIAAGVVAHATASTWHPQACAPPHLIRGVAFAAVDRAGNNLLDEFAPDLKVFGRRIWYQLVRK